VSSVENKYKKVLGQLGANLKKIRKSRNLSQTDMVEHGFELRNYQRIESGRHSPSLFTLHRLALVFDCELKDLFDF
jgi:transcriptional regulator with XRE-family HTH domain